MDILSPSKVVLAVIVVVGTCIFSWVLNRRRQLSFFKRHGIPGPTPDLFSGNLSQLKKDRLEVMESWIKQYGKVFGYYIGVIPYMVVADMEIIKQCFVREINVAFDRPKLLFNLDPSDSSLLAITGEEWKKVRATLNTIFTSKYLKMMTQIIADCNQTMIGILDDAVAKGQIVDMEEVSRGFAMDVITKSTLAWKVDCQDDPNHPFYVGVRKHFGNTDNTNTINAIGSPILRKLYGFVFPDTSEREAMAEICGHIQKMIDLRRKGQQPPSTDMLQFMLEKQTLLQDSPVDPGKDMSLEDRHCVSNCLTFIFAGFGTTAIGLTFVMHLLAKHPEEQERIYSELTKALPDGGDITYDAVQQLKRLDMVLCEALRMFPPSVHFVKRACNKDTTVMGHFFPAGVSIQAPVWHMHHDPALWPDPFKFNPERFSDGSKTYPGWLPFGIGPRVCVGQRFAMLQLKMAVASVVRRYKIFQCDQTQDPVKVCATALTIKPEKGMNARLERR